MAIDTFDFLTIGDASRFLERSPDTLRVWDRIGKLPAMRTPSGIRIWLRADVQRMKERLTAREHAHVA